MAVYVKLKTIQYVEVDGKIQKCHPGDWVHVGRQTAERWIAQGDAWRPNAEIEVPAGSGVWVRGLAIPGCKTLEALPYVDGDEYDIPPYPRTLLWDPTLGFRHELLGVGFRLLDRWQLAAPIFSYDQLACHLSDETDRQRTESAIRDLRVPVYDTRLMFVRRCAETNALFRAWRAERERGDDERLAFMRALYRIKPTLCALPTTWTGERRR